MVMMAAAAVVVAGRAERMEVARKVVAREVLVRVEVMMAVERAVKVEKPVADSGKWSHTPLRCR